MNSNVIWEVYVFNKEFPKRERTSFFPESGYAVLVWSRDFTESAVFVLFCFKVNFTMANEIEWIRM